jgi:hypothetical protein
VGERKVIRSTSLLYNPVNSNFLDLFLLTGVGIHVLKILSYFYFLYIQFLLQSSYFCNWAITGDSGNEILGCADGLRKDDEGEEGEGEREGEGKEWNCCIARSITICVLFMAGVAQTLQRRTGGMEVQGSIPERFLFCTSST